MALFPGNLTFDDFSKQLFLSLVSSTRSSNLFPEGSAHTFYCTTYPFFKERVREFGNRLLVLQQRTITHLNPFTDTNITDLDPQFDNLAKRFEEEIVETTDTFLEKIDLYFDELKGEKEKSRIVSKTVLFKEKGQKQREIIYAKNILRPQDQWRHRVDNSYSVFIPRITHKPNAKIPLPEAQPTFASLQ
eukprot:TRINITY_DN16024_c0_g1_i1.p1 TRINITY_DN16024_c0_g1~~TRINITY_DN16024_c0_g1_i1.p1  ORF type:complete len:189 (-),score=34.27 TRINITY_DN16024_c0_g1_i1:168-734(-)